MILENEGAGMKCDDSDGGTLMRLLDRRKMSVFSPSSLCSPNHKDKAHAAFSSNIACSQSLAWIRQSWNRT